MPYMVKDLSTDGSDRGGRIIRVYSKTETDSISTSRDLGWDVVDSDTDCAVVDGKVGYCVPSTYHGWKINNVIAGVHTKGVTGTMDIQIRRRRAGTDNDVLSTKVTVGDEFYAADGVVDEDYNTMATGDIIFIDIDTVHTTPAKGLFVTLTLVSS